MGVKSVSTIFVSTFWLLMNKYDSIWNTNALQLSKAFIDEAYGIALSVGVERFELPISCSQSRRVNRTTLYPEKSRVSDGTWTHGLLGHNQVL